MVRYRFLPAAVSTSVAAASRQTHSGWVCCAARGTLDTAQLLQVGAQHSLGELAQRRRGVVGPSVSAPGAGRPPARAERRIATTRGAQIAR